MQKKIINACVEQKEKKSRAKFECPDLLAGAIAELRLVSANADLPDKQAIFEQNKLVFHSNLTVEEYNNLLFVRNKKVLEECVKDFTGDHARLLFNFFYSAELRENKGYPEYILKNRALYNALEEYEKFCAQRNLLHSIAQFFGYLRAGDVSFEEDREITTKSGKTIKFPSLPPVLFSRNGTIGEVKSQINDVLHHLDLDRIRECEICSNIHWAKNKNSFTCSERCRNALRQRNHREKNKVEISEKRKAIYRSKKEQRLAKERAKKNGTL